MRKTLRCRPMLDSSTSKHALELNIILALLYYTLLRPTIELFWGAGAPTNTRLSQMITALPLLLAGISFVVHLESQKHTAPVQAPGFLYLFLTLFFLSFTAAVMLGLATTDSTVVVDIQRYTILFSLSTIAFITIRNIQDIYWLFGRYLSILAVFAMLRFSYFVSILWLGQRFTLHDSWTNGLLISLGYCVFLSRLVLNQGTAWKNIVAFLVFAGGSLITFHKPLVWSIGLSTIAIVSIAIFRFKQHSNTLRVLIILMMMVVLVLIIIDFVSELPILEDYRRQFYLRYLKVHPDSGRTIGTLSGGRFTLWQEAITKIWRKPLFGYGLGMTLTGMGKFDNVNVHNTPLHLLLTLGMVGFLPMLGLIIVWLIPVWRSLDSQDSLRLGLFGYTALIAAFSLIGVLFVSSKLIYLFGVVCGSLLKAALIDTSERI